MSEPQPQPLPPNRDATPLEWARLRLERQKLAIELIQKRRETRDKHNRGAWQEFLANPLAIAIVGGILTLMTTVVTNYLTATANRLAEESRATLARDAARQTLQADLIKKFVEGPRPENVRENLRFLSDSGLIPDYVNSISRYLRENPQSAPQLGSLVSFSQAGEAVPENLQHKLRNVVVEFRDFLRSKGFSNLDGNISVFIYSADAKIPIPNFPYSSNVPGSFYFNNTIYIHRSLSEDLSLALREFSHHALMKAVGEQNFRQTAIESALADYLPATFLKSPIIGSAYAKVENPPFMGFRNVDSSVRYDAAGTRGPQGWFMRGIVWSAALWACRNPDHPESVDDILLSAWRKASVLPLDEDAVEGRFGALLTASPRPLGDCLLEQIARRQLPTER